MKKNEILKFITNHLIEHNIKFFIKQKNGIDIFIINGSLKYKIIISEKSVDLFEFLHQVEDFEYIFELDNPEEFYKDVVLFSINGFEEKTKELLSNFFIIQNKDDFIDFIKKIK